MVRKKVYLSNDRLNPESEGDYKYNRFDRQEGKNASTFRRSNFFCRSCRRICLFVDIRFDQAIVNVHFWSNKFLFSSYPLILNWQLLQFNLTFVKIVSYHISFLQLYVFCVFVRLCRKENEVFCFVRSCITRTALWRQHYLRFSLQVSIIFFRSRLSLWW